MKSFSGSSRCSPSDQRCVYGLRMCGLKTEVCESSGEGARGVEGSALGKKLAEPRPAVGAVVVVEVLFGESAAMFDRRLLKKVS